MKMDFLRFPSMFCQARSWLRFSKFSFPLDYVSFCCLSYLCRNKRGREAFPHHTCSNPLAPGSSTSQAVTFILKGLPSFITFPPFSIHSTWLRNRGCSPLGMQLWRAPALPPSDPKRHSSGKRQAVCWPGSVTSRLSKLPSMQNNLNLG